MHRSRPTGASRSSCFQGGNAFSSGVPENRRAFTLIELLVAMAAVALLVLIVGLMMSNTSSLITISDKKVDADSEARTIFDRMAGDFAAMVKRSDVDYQFNNLANKQNGSATMFFYSEAPGISATGIAADDSSASLIGYRINNSGSGGSYQLERLGKGLQWMPNAGPSQNGPPNSGMVYLTYAPGSFPLTFDSKPLAGCSLADVFPSILMTGSTDTNYHPLGADVFRFTFWFLLKPSQKQDGTYLPALYSNYPYDTRRTPPHTSLTGLGLADVQAIVVGIAILDAASRHLLSAGTNWGQLAAALPDPVDPFVAPNWETTVANTSSFASVAGIPAAAASQARVYQKTFNLITPNAP